MKTNRKSLEMPHLHLIFHMLQFLQKNQLWITFTIQLLLIFLL